MALVISYNSSGERLLKYQANSSCVIMSVIFMTTLFYKALIVLLLQGEIWCWSLLGLKELIENLIDRYTTTFLVALLLGAVWRWPFKRNLVTVIYGVWTRGQLKRGCVTAALFILFLMPVTRLCSLWNSRLNYLWMTDNRSFVSNKICLPSIIIQIKLTSRLAHTSLLRTPR